MKFLITGHTGFKGSWLAVFLKTLGHEVHGIALQPKAKSLFVEAQIESYLNSNSYIDIRNGKKLKKEFEKIEPEVIIHLAAQPLVSKSYIEPVKTYDINVIGTLNVLEATKNLNSLLATQIITTDKVYKNKSKLIGYLETDELGGDDPYSSSKSSADIATQSWRKSYGKTPVAISRSGNVIGGGDWSKNRLIPDIFYAYSLNSPLHLRNSNAIRPWQHVLDCLDGYLRLVDKQIKDGIESEWNFGPDQSKTHTVMEVVDIFSKKLNFSINVIEVESDFEENQTLVLNSSKSQNYLGWRNKLDFDQTLDWTADWYLSKNKIKITKEQIIRYMEL